MRRAMHRIPHLFLTFVRCSPFRFAEEYDEQGRVILPPLRKFPSLVKTYMAFLSARLPCFPVTLPFTGISSSSFVFSAIHLFFALITDRPLCPSAKTPPSTPTITITTINTITTSLHTVPFPPYTTSPLPPPHHLIPALPHPTTSSHHSLHLTTSSHHSLHPTTSSHHSLHPTTSSHHSLHPTTSSHHSLHLIPPLPPPHHLILSLPPPHHLIPSLPPHLNEPASTINKDNYPPEQHSTLTATTLLAGSSGHFSSQHLQES
ncbi:hypothetical protein Pcinc_026910 [Petrolisthes cinctipes]|uniref:Uncharacterized protein n=1 Tax=Petrolisthes cinctipes TaxID=88211 RepID=A0AAE1F533_PETCI|nr:hypothetical protein Pcinc_026910 [Petrolisthes cinctipes]